jgi:hypothetical protein
VVFVFLTTATDRAAAARRALSYGLPLIPIGVFIAWQKLVVGGFFWIVEPAIPLIELDRSLARRKLVRLTEWLFVHQLRWLFTALIVLHLLLTARARQSKEWWLFALIVVLSGYSFYVLYFLPRYLLPVMPYLYLGGAAALMALVPTRIGRVVAALLLLALVGWSLPRQPFAGNAEFNLRYCDVVALHATACDFITSELDGRRIATLWPHTVQLSRPFLGYVKRPVPVASLETDAPAADDVVVVSVPGTHHDHTSLRAEVERKQWRLIRQFQHDGAVVGVYRRG